MQYTQHGGLAFVSQNCGWYVFYYEGPLKKSLNPNLAIAALEYDMVYDDASSNWGHRDNILDKWHNKVSIGIAYDETHLALVQNFENDYITWNKKIEYSNGTISLSGKTSLGELQAIAIYYDPLPTPLTKDQLLKYPYNGAYSLGDEIGYILPSPYYTKKQEYVHASKWTVISSGFFDITADITPFLKHGNGVYTVVVWIKMGDEDVPLTNYSIYIIED